MAKGLNNVRMWQVWKLIFEISEKDHRMLKKCFSSEYTNKYNRFNKAKYEQE